MLPFCRHSMSSSIPILDNFNFCPPTPISSPCLELAESQLFFLVLDTSSNTHTHTRNKQQWDYSAKSKIIIKYLYLSILLWYTQTVVQYNENNNPPSWHEIIVSFSTTYFQVDIKCKETRHQSYTFWSCW